MQCLGFFQMTATLISIVDIQKQTAVHWEEMMKEYKTYIKKAQKEKHAAESQFGVLESVKTALNRSLKEAKVAWMRLLLWPLH